MIDFWALVSVFVVFGGAFIALLRRFDQGRRTLLNRKRTFLAELHNQLENNPAIGRAVSCLKQTDIQRKLEDLLAPEAKLLTGAEVAIKNDLNVLFGLLNRIAQAVAITKILTR